MRVERRPAKYTSKRRRHESITRREMQQLSWYTNSAALFLIMSVTSQSERDQFLFSVLFLCCYMKRENLRWVDHFPLQAVPQKLYTINSFDDNDCYRLLRFRKGQLRKLFTGLGVYNLPEWVVIDESSRNLYHREMAFLVLLFRYATAGTFFKMSLDGWGDESVVCRAFNFASYYLHEQRGHLVRNDLRRASARFPEFNNAIRRLVMNKIGNDQPLPRDAVCMALLMDGTRRDIAEPVDIDIEASSYCGYSGTHCVGYLSLVDPTGMCDRYVDYIYNPTKFRYMLLYCRAATWSRSGSCVRSRLWR